MARRRRRSQTREGAIFKLAVVGAIGIAALISVLVSNATGKFNTQAFLIIFFVSLVVILTAAIILSLPSVKGKIGEHRVSKKLIRLTKKYYGYVINDVMIPGENGKTSQLDHILISEYGVFVVETKNYAGRIYGTDEQQNWTQVLAYGHSKNKLYNPVKQNQTHIVRLKELLRFDSKYKVNPHSVVVFVKANVDHVQSEYVYGISDLRRLIDKEDDKEFTTAQVDEIYYVINEYKNNPVKTNKEHVLEIKQMQKDILNNVCPRCGGKLVERNTKDGRSFYGCSNYPKCRFVKK